MYLFVKGNDFAFCYDFSIILPNCSDSVLFLVFQFITAITILLLIDINTLDKGKNNKKNKTIKYYDICSYYSNVDMIRIFGA